MSAITRNFTCFALAAALASCQCGDREGREAEESAEQAAEASGESSAEGGYRVLVTGAEVRLSGDTVGDTRALAREPAGGAVPGLARALEARSERGQGSERMVLEASAEVPAAAIRRVWVTAREAGIREIVFLLAGGESPRRLEPDPPEGEAPILEVEIASDELRVADDAGKTWTIPIGGPRGGRKVLEDVLRARKEAEDLRDRDDVEVIVRGGASYGALFEALEAAAASGFDRPRLAAPEE